MLDEGYSIKGSTMCHPDLRWDALLGVGTLVLSVRLGKVNEEHIHHAM